MNKYGPQHVDADLVKTIALKNGAGAVSTVGIDLGSASARGKHFELEAITPDHNTTQAPDTRTCTLTIEQADDSAFSTNKETLWTKVYTGAGSAGFTGGAELAKLPSNGRRYVRATWTNGASMGDCSGLTGTFRLLVSNA